MADTIIITPQPTYVSITQSPWIWTSDIRTAIDISQWDFLDLQVGILSYSNTVDVTFSFPTSMQNTVDDKSWEDGFGASAGSLLFQSSFVNIWKTVSLPASTAALLKYLRFRVKLNNASGNLTFMISGLGRKR